tara:strand:+ start:4249 stop:4461 length:213 start_codon:yes stop_codon:yes gene_type:complete
MTKNIEYWKKPCPKCKEIRILQTGFIREEFICCECKIIFSYHPYDEDNKRQVIEWRKIKGYDLGKKVMWN